MVLDSAINGMKNAAQSLGLVGGGRTRSGRRYGLNSISKKTRKQRSNKGVKRGPRTGKTRSGRRFRGVTRLNSASVRRVLNSTPKKRKQRSNKGKKRRPYGPRTGKTRSGRRFRF